MEERKPNKKVWVYDIDDRHMIEEWEEENGTRHYIPHFSRTGRSWEPYRRNGEMVSFSSYPAGTIHAYQQARSTITTARERRALKWVKQANKRGGQRS